MKRMKESKIILRGACGHVCLWVAAVTSPHDCRILVVMHRCNQPLAVKKMEQLGWHQGVLSESRHSCRLERWLKSAGLTFILKRRAFFVDAV